jgi:co-chaperonin GroES (HSP10)
MSVKEGDSVLVYKSNLGENKSIMINDEDYYLIRESEVGLVKSAK